MKETENPKDADLVMVNTCSIRQLSEDKAFSQIGVWGQWKKTSKPDLKNRILRMRCPAEDERSFQKGAVRGFRSWNP